MDIISTCTTRQAVEDGVLVDLGKINPLWKDRGLFSHITSSCYNRLCCVNEDLRMVRLIDLLNNVNQMVYNKSNELKDPDTFFSGEIEMFNGAKQKIFVALNEYQRFTIMLPEDY